MADRIRQRLGAEDVNTTMPKRAHQIILSEGEPRSPQFVPQNPPDRSNTNTRMNDFPAPHRELMRKKKKYFYLSPRLSLDLYIRLFILSMFAV